jgi:hypothetical protein
LPAQAAVRSRHDGWPPTTWGIGTPAGPSVFFGQHDRDHAPGYDGVGRIGRVVGQALIVIDPMQAAARPQRL